MLGPGGYSQTFTTNYNNTRVQAFPASGVYTIYVIASNPVNVSGLQSNTISIQVYALLDNLTFISPNPLNPAQSASATGANTCFLFTLKSGSSYNCTFQYGITLKKEIQVKHDSFNIHKKNCQVTELVSQLQTLQCCTTTRVLITPTQRLASLTSADSALTSIRMHRTPLCTTF
jgi:hypothetical protein